MSFADREKKRKNSSVVGDITNFQPKIESTVISGDKSNTETIDKLNTNSKNESNEQNEVEKDKSSTIPKTFYIAPYHAKALAFEKALTGKDFSEIVRESLNAYFGDDLDQYK